jgi:PPP family 3-phenylpropionic acid transporter
MISVRLNDYFSVRLAAFYATLGIATGVGMPFFPVWLAFKGLDPVEIGIVLAAPMVVRIFFVPLTTRLADRYNMLRGAIVIASIGSALGNIAITFSPNFLLITAMMVMSAIFFTPTFPLADAYALRGLSERGRTYGPVRLWSSAAYIAANLGSGFVIGMIPKDGIMWLISSAFVIGAALAITLIPVNILHYGSGPKPPPAKSLWRMPVFVAVVAACAAIQASHAVYYGFSTLDWSAKGLSAVTIGALWALGVVAEIALFAMSGRIARFVGPVTLVILGAVGGIVRWTAMAFDPPFVLLPFLQCLHALTFCATHIGAMQFLTHVAPPGQMATAQGDLSAAHGAVFSIAMGLSGFMFSRYGDFSYLAMTLLCVLGLAAAVAAKVMQRSPRAL